MIDVVTNDVQQSRRLLNQLHLPCHVNGDVIPGRDDVAFLHQLRRDVRLRVPKNDQSIMIRNAFPMSISSCQVPDKCAVWANVAFDEQ